MAKLNYSKRDLVWEATRRNEIYREYYYKMASEHQETISKWDTIGDSICYRFRLPGLYDPSVSVDEINEQIENGANPEEVHPYYYMFGQEENPVTYHHVPKEFDSIFKNAKLAEELYENESAEHDQLTKAESDKHIFEWMKTFMDTTRGRIVVSIDPLVINTPIIEETKRIINQVRREIRVHNEHYKKCGNLVLNPAKIESYIGWLKTYNDTVIKIEEKVGKENITIENGVVEEPDDFKFWEMVPKGTPGEKFAKQEQGYRENFRDAKKLIQETPNLKFNPTRAERGK